MNDEIKECLDSLYYQDDYSSISYDKLLDYITNLQQENERLNNQLDFIEEQNKYIDRLEKIIREKTSRIDKAIEYMKKNEFININNYWEVVEFYQDLLNILQNGSDSQ